MSKQDRGWLIWMDQIVIRLPVFLGTAFLNFILKPKRGIRGVDRKLSENKEQEKVD